MIIAIKGLFIKKKTKAQTQKNKNKNKTLKQIQIFNERTLTTLVSVINNDNQQAILSEKKLTKFSKSPRSARKFSDRKVQ